MVDTPRKSNSAIIIMYLKSRKIVFPNCLIDMKFLTIIQKNYFISYNLTDLVS